MRQRESADSRFQLGQPGTIWGMILAALSLLAAVAVQAAEPAASRKIDFNYQIRPILSDKCFNCHGPDPASARPGCGWIRRTGLLPGSKSEGHAIVPGNLDESELVGADHGRG